MSKRDRRKDDRKEKDAVLVKTPLAEMQVWRRLALAEKRSLTSLIRVAMQRYLRDHKRMLAREEEAAK